MVAPPKEMATAWAAGLRDSRPQQRSHAQVWLEASELQPLRESLGLSSSALGWGLINSDQGQISSQAAGSVLGIMFNLILEE